VPTTYAGGVRDLSDLQLVKEAGKERIDVTVGSALDIFGGKKLTYREAVTYCRGGEGNAPP
jgi:phosphoribosylformimino-5-aminoimidazole carboxamide ribotide isomerase